ncbi:uncharacterized protein BDZ83DRAFT_616324 [Colletotrichum acutatum]|uniref:Uncharacterized protein n=1 Tax=Glomerella acutata TaxID=27357 RepID=A0AAD8UR48_GLOAC|nr:uncharacterized protein BDZ83DRAFT_616324 [Colletotrichum acutatum]KAK1726334.1 hypothetical protein BDZ83DRAFT_616324 [Colletotrichum acutatum]
MYPRGRSSGQSLNLVRIWYSLLAQLTLEVMLLSPCQMCVWISFGQAQELQPVNSPYLRDMIARRSRQKASPVS